MTGLRRRTLLALGSAAGTTLLGGCGRLPFSSGQDCGPSGRPVDTGLAPGWPMRNRDAGNTRADRSLDGPDLADVTELASTLVYVGDTNLSEPVVADGVAYVYDDGEAIAVDAVSGTTKWATTLGGTAGGAGAATITAETVFLPTEENGLWALERESGATVWHASDTVARQVSPTAERLVVSTASEGIYGLDPRCGEREWNAVPDTDGGISVANESVYTTADSSLLALSPADGSVQRRVPINSAESLIATPVLVEETALVFDESGTIHAVDVPGRAVRWSASDHGDVFYAGTAATTERIFVATRDAGTHRVHAYDMQKGDKLWQTPLDGRYRAGLTGVSNGLFALSDGTAFDIDPSSGAIRHAVPLGVGSFEPQGNLVVTDEGLYVTVGFEATSHLVRLAPG